MIVTVHDYRLKSLNNLLRGVNHRQRAAARRTERENIQLLLISQNEPPEKPIPGPIAVFFCHLYATSRPDVDGYWKLVGDALQKAGFIEDDGNIEELVLTRLRVDHVRQQGFEAVIKPVSKTGTWRPPETNP